MSSEILTIKVTKRKGPDRRIVLGIDCTRDDGEEGIAHYDEYFNPDEDIRRVKDSRDFKLMMEIIETRAAKLICMQLY